MSFASGWLFDSMLCLSLIIMVQKLLSFKKKIVPSLNAIFLLNLAHYMKELLVEEIKENCHRNCKNPTGFKNCWCHTMYTKKFWAWNQFSHKILEKMPKNPEQVENLKMKMKFHAEYFGYNPAHVELFFMTSNPLEMVRKDQTQWEKLYGAYMRYIYWDNCFENV